MIGALFALLSLDMTRKLVTAGLVASTLVVIDATNTSPIVVTTSTPHGFVRPAHAELAAIGGNDAANGTWVCTPTSSTTLTLSTFSMAGARVPSVGSGAYSSGGTLKTAFPDGSILLGDRNVAMQTAVATPRIVVVPLGSGGWVIDPYGGVIPPGILPRRLADETAEQRFMKRSRQLNTEPHRFEVHVTGCATPPDPDFGDFDVTQAIYHSLYESMFNMISPDRARVLRGNWERVGLDVRGQKWVGIVEIKQPVTDNPLSFIPTSTDATIRVHLIGSSSSEDTVIQITPFAP